MNKQIDIKEERNQELLTSHNVINGMNLSPN